MTDTIKQLQKQKQEKLKKMDIKNIKAYIDRNMAYYYSHYVMSMEDILTKKRTIDSYESLKDDSVKFIDAYNENLDVIFKNIEHDFKLTGEQKQGKINFILATIYKSELENLRLNVKQDYDILERLIDGYNESIQLRMDIHYLISVFVSFVNDANSLLLTCKRLVLTLHQLVIFDVNDTAFDIVNKCFKSVWLDFYFNYVCATHSKGDVIDLFYEKLDSDDIFVDKLKDTYDDAIKTLNELDDSFNDFVKDNDLFSYVKDTLDDGLFDKTIVYDLKSFNVVYPSDNVANPDDIIDDTYIMMKELEKEFKVHILF